MNWKNLNNSKCPKCNSNLYDVNIHIVRCRNQACDFVIRSSRLKELLSDKPKFKDNQEALNNLNYKEQSEGFLEENLKDW